MTVLETDRLLGEEMGLLTLEAFASAMKKYLTLAKREDLDILLRSLYQVAAQKLILERARETAPDRVNQLRKKKSRMSEAKKLIVGALYLLRKALGEYPTELQNIGGTIDSLEDDRNSLRNTIKYLENAAKSADNWQLMFSGMIHPHLRNQIEKREAKRQLLSGIVAETLLPGSDYPARPKSPEIDHWFIGAIAELLDQYTTGTKKRIPGYPQIIRALFEIAFQDWTRTEESVRIELRRQRKLGRPATPIVVSREVMATYQKMVEKREAGQKQKK